jgi:hypothetical protein
MTVLMVAFALGIWVGGSAQRFESRAKLNDAVSAPEAAHNPFSSSPYASKADFAK